ncbi:MAG TPA: PrgI family protein [Candidatus Kaiserbacteria bacterium]|nr:PrgI family protein [Candidatus Kaiserbacteria bacterium]
MKYQVPQFVDVESKIIGPLTLKQFIYVAGGIGACFLLLHFLPFLIAILLCIPVAGFAGALAFYKVNGKPFERIIEAAVTYYSSSRFFIWKKEQVPVKPKMVSTAQPTEGPKNTVRLTRGKLHNLARSLDEEYTRGNVVA